MRTLVSYPAPSQSTTLAGRRIALGFFMLIASIVFVCAAVAEEPASGPAVVNEAGSEAGDALDQALQAEPIAEAPASKPAPKLAPYLPPPEGAQPLSKKGRAWMDREKNQVIVDGRISLRRGLLEMFACPPNTKEHESIVAVDSEAFVLHAGLLAVGAETGSPVEFTPKYQAPTGTKIDIDVLWKDQNGKQRKVRAQEWIRDARTKKQMELPWVFAGSGFWRDEATGNSGYMAEAGDLVCVANFSTAMLDVPAEVTSDNAGLLYEANTDRIPSLGWPVRLVLKPVLEKPAVEADETERTTAKDKTASKPQP